MTDTTTNVARLPATDWTTDWDHLDPRWRNDPYPIWDELRGTCPIAHTKRFMGAYLPTRYEDVKAIAYDTEHFSSRRVVVREFRAETIIPAPPITSDPPRHKALKQILLPPFLPEEIARIEPKARAICNELIDGFIADGHCDAAQRYTRHIPVRVIAHMLGVPEEDGDLYIRWIHEILELGITDDAIMWRAFGEMTEYFIAEIAKRKGAPRDDLITRVMGARIDGETIPEELGIGMLRLLLIAGIDTTWSGIGAALWHLARTPEDARRLIAEPELMPTAIEEFLRAFAPVTMAREVMKDTEINGCPIKAGNMVLLSFPAANRDPAMFADADKVLIDRKENRHAAFGLGIHRCVGSNLARMEMTVAVEEWLKRIPQFRLDAGKAVAWSEGTVRGPRALPVIFGAA
ncbi:MULTISPECIES: cytochrome P450 [Rhodomicrobium]|uniref:cytochrome P450 n=1 Tax=Rhodomicrobium TaxID=1068 RepID=UPI000B4ABB41|nr:MULTISPECIES: cytochrome P450 [Rhodomicrobium]